MPGRSLLGAAAAIMLLAALPGCAVSAPPRTGPLLACASINAWGSILAQLGGSHVRTTAIVRNPATDPRGYEPAPADAKLIAVAAVFVQNGAGYDSWAAKAVGADPEPNRQLVDVAR